MSYDLYFVMKDNQTDSEIIDYFKSSQNYLIDKNSKTAMYQNKDTGVYFDFGWGSDISAERATANSTWSFTINFYRPSCFALEAWPEIERFLSAFEPCVHDDQTGGGEEPFTRERFISSWNHGNRFAHGAVRKEGFEAPPTYTAAALERIWRWNFGRADLQRRLGDTMFVPRVMFLQVDGQTISMVVWGDGLPGAFPNVDMVMIFRDQLAPWRLLGPKQDNFLVPWRDVAAVIESVAADRIEGGYLLDYEKPPELVERFFKGLKPTNHQIVGLSVDQVLDRELTME